MASNLQEESSGIHTCYVCRVQVPLGSKTRHEASYLHQAAVIIATTALERLRAHVAPISKSVTEPAEPSREKEHKDTSTVFFCGACASVFPSPEHAKHIRTKTHLMAALDDQVFDELVRGYVDEEEIQFLDGISKYPCDDEERAIDQYEAANTYTCLMCALEIPKALKNEHELGTRHHACLALANAASQRAIAFLTRTHIRVDHPTRSLEDKMVALLKVYTGVDIKKQVHVETEEIEVTKDKTSNVKKGLTSKEYFTEIMPFIQYVGGFYTLIIDDTDYITIKTEKDIYLRVHVSNFNGIYNIGDTEEYQMKCRMCDGDNTKVSYSSKGNIDRLHIMSLGHIKNVLTPIANVHGIRKIDNAHSHLCVLCNAFVPIYSVQDHVMKDIQHTAFLAKALEKGKLFKESETDIKFIIYTAPPVEMSDFFTKHSPPNVNSHGAIFGQNSTTSTDTGFGKATASGQSTGQSGSLFGDAQPESREYFGKSGTVGASFGQSTTSGQSNNQSSPHRTAKPASNQPFWKASFGQYSGTGYGQINHPINLKASEQQASKQYFGNGGTFGISTGFGQSPGTGFGESQTDISSPQSAFGSTPLGKNIAQNTGSLYGNNLRAKYSVAILTK